MEVEKQENVESLRRNEDIPGEECRICMKRCDELWNLFGGHENIPRKIMALAAVQIEEGDGLPTAVCSSCLQLLEMSLDFKCQIEKSDATLREILMSKVSLDRDIMKVSLSQSVNAVITEAIADELPNAEIIASLEKQIQIENDLSIEGLQRPIIQVDEQIVVENFSHDQDTISFEISDSDCTQVKLSSPDEVETVENIEDEENDGSMEGEMNLDESKNVSNMDSSSTSLEDQSEVVISMAKLSESMKSDPIKKEELLLPEENELLEIDDSLDNHESIFQEEEIKIEIKKDSASENEQGDASVEAGSQSQGNYRDKSEENDDSDEEKPLICRTRRQKCPHCIKTFATKLGLQRHMIIHKHKTKLRYVCYLCDKQFSNVAKLKNHVTNNHDCLKNEPKPEIESNSEKMESYKNLEKFEKDVSSSLEKGKMDKKGLKFKCRACEKQFTYQKAFLTHIKMHPGYDNCDHLDGSLEPADPLEEQQEHQNDSSSSKVNESDDDDMPLEGLQCTQCGKLFATKRNLKRHISTHSGLRFNCSTCSKEFSRLDKLKEHEHSKHKEEIFGQSDEDDDEYTENENKTNDGSDSRRKEKNSRPHQCALCPKAFAQPQSLANHMERHKRVKETQKRFLCEVCSKCFAQSGSLVAHMRTHTGVKPYVCNVCSRAFTKSTYLQLHLRTHSGEKPYICQYCSRAFARANTLARHITMHTGEAKYHCQICMKSFRRLTSLNEHTYTHTGQRPYACKICTKRYNNAGSLYAHTKKCKAQQLSGPTTTYTVSVDNTTTHHNGGPVPQMLIYSQRKLNEAPVGQVPPTPQFMITNVQSQKPVTTNIIQPFAVDDPNFYTVNPKQFKNPYYTIYPNM